MGKKDWESYFASLKKQDWESAKNALLSLLKEEKNNPQLNLKIGDVYQRLGDTANAIASYLLAGRILEYHGFSQKALAAFKIILRIDPTNREVIARAQAIMDDIESAKSTRLKPAGLMEQPAAPVLSETPAPERPMPAPSPAPPGAPSEELPAPSAPAALPEAPSRPSEWLESTSLKERTPEPPEEITPPTLKEEPPAQEVSPPEPAEETGGEEDWLKSAYDAIDKSVQKEKTGRVEQRQAAQEEEFITLRLPEELPGTGAPGPATEDEISGEPPSELRDLMRPLSDRPGILSKPDILSDIPDDVYREFIRDLDARSFRHGQTVIEEGDAGDTMFLVKSGRARVVAHLLGREIELALLSEGDLFGEVGFLTGRPRTASVIAEGDLEVLEISRTTIEMLIDMNPEVMAKLEEFYESRVMDTIKKIKS